MNKKTAYGITAAVILIAVVGIYFWSQGSGGQAASAQNNQHNFFEGKIIRGNTTPQTYTNARILTDEGCVTDPKTGLANCVTQVQTTRDILYFNYEHNMMITPCLSQGDRVTIHVFANGTATVYRTYWTGGGV